MERLSRLLLIVFLLPTYGHAFCGYYVSKADTKLFNKASKVILVRDGDRTVLTMANDFKGDVKEFAMIVPVPTVLEKEQINVAENAIVDRVDAFTAPRLVEYYDEDPCAMRMYEKTLAMSASGGAPMKKGRGAEKDLGVTVEAQYTVGEYDILILSAKESSGLLTWLKENEYKIADSAVKTLESYIKQDLKFFVAKVNLKELAKSGNEFLRPLQMAYESTKFMLPIRLGTLNADGDQELFVFAVTKKGRVETVNYRTVSIPSELELPLLIKDDKQFKKFYQDMFATAHRREDAKAVFLEYAWNMSWCDPCAAEPLTPEELKKIGVFWMNESERPGVSPMNKILPRSPRPNAPVEAYISRLHVRYNAQTFPEDLRFQVTSNQENFQGRYILRHPFTGKITCDAGKEYQKQLVDRSEKEIANLLHVTGWKRSDLPADLASEVPVTDDKDQKKKKWWQKLWD
ncbi:MAG: hypothetical protein COW00_00755 [Bdellovibrio sp. CG12_big_fil_rev_8_21_14_0_65_39_13]|nr:MAG: hypothetical protein COW78_04690 [Bdellovibrio sp. CG22_combo_CG10-13_8_21_14_all_39_27]PIQ63012.1 MAG: hypothetical protein COW00_00755 [Bdellovibrio sp. CG12_big_fil_rev_8_21_14_0_65_39_13]PIR32687.1 MAG: hypothetical protein COV37_19240 [Bdellovibrio sp. CG11_big_fil_rev_8_21_14_0_20_39_38]